MCLLIGTIDKENAMSPIYFLFFYLRGWGRGWDTSIDTNACTYTLNKLNNFLLFLSFCLRRTSCLNSIVNVIYDQSELQPIKMQNQIFDHL